MMKLKKRFLSILAAGFIGATSIFAGVKTADFVSVTTVEAAANSYGLANTIQEGNILHCFDWKYSDITAELANIAKAGFTSVQTSPSQGASGSGNWYWLYQPKGFTIATSNLGTKEDLKKLCTEADKYGIKVIVDVVANHLSGNKNAWPSDLRDSQYWHNTKYNSSNINWSVRFQVTHGDIGMPDINSESSYVQQKVLAYVKELKSIGVDGIRWDAAKHISLPSESCDFWKVVTNQGLYNYGEILEGPTNQGTSNSTNKTLMKEYTTYMSVTDDVYSRSLREAFRKGTVPSGYAYWGTAGIANNKMVYFGESHDTWSNGNSYDNSYTQNQIDRAYAIAGSRNGVTALYFSRPATNVKEKIQIGQKGSTHFTSKEVAAVNHFRNYCGNEKEYYVNASGNKAGAACAVCRESGATVVLGSGGNKEITISNGGGTTKPGTYYDEITGNKWVVTSTSMTGTVGDTGIAVFYKGVEAPDITKKAPYITALKNVSNGINIIWNPVVGADGYEIYKKEGNGDFILLKKTTLATTFNFVDTRVSNNKTYTYRIKAYNNEKKTVSMASGSKTMMRIVANKINSVQNVSTGVEVKWSKVSNATCYMVYRKTSTSAWTFLKKTTALSFIDTTAKSGYDYIYGVITYVGDYHSGVSDNVSCRRLLPPTVTLTNPSGGVKVSWTSSKGATGYYIYRKTASTGWTLIKTIGSGTTVSYTDTTAAKGTTYTYAIKSFNGSSQSVLSATKSIKRNA